MALGFIIDDARHVVELATIVLKILGYEMARTLCMAELLLNTSKFGNGRLLAILPAAMPIFDACSRSPAQAASAMVRVTIIPYRVVTASAARRDNGLPLYHNKLPHHTGVFVFQNMAVEHVGFIRVGEVTKMGDKSDRFARHNQHGVFPAAFIFWRL